MLGPLPLMMPPMVTDEELAGDDAERGGAGTLGEDARGGT